MLSDVVVQTPDGPHRIPEWAACYCVTVHRPAVLHPLPYVMPDGNTLYLCPGAHHQTSTLYSVYLTLKGTPGRDILKKFIPFSQKLAKRCYTIKLQMERDSAG